MDQQPASEREQKHRQYKQALERAQAHAAQRRVAPPAIADEPALESAVAPAEPGVDEQAAPLEPAEAPRPRALSMTPAAPRALDAARILDVRAPAAPEVRRPPLILAPVAGLAWGGVILLLVFGNFGPHAPLQQRLFYMLLLLLAGLLTFVPLQWSLRLPALSWRGTLGWGLLFYTLAFIPAPSGWLLDLPDMPVYLLLMLGVFLAVDAAAVPVVYALGQRLYQQRTERFDLRRASRQAAEVGIFAAGVVGLAAMQLLDIRSLLLLVAILAIIEIFILGGRRL